MMCNQRQIKSKDWKRIRSEGIKTSKEERGEKEEKIGTEKW